MENKGNLWKDEKIQIKGSSPRQKKSIIYVESEIFRVDTTRNYGTMGSVPSGDGRRGFMYGRLR